MTLLFSRMTSDESKLSKAFWITAASLVFIYIIAIVVTGINISKTAPPPKPKPKPKEVDQTIDESVAQ